MTDELAGITPVVILGAARSGTNILRDVLSSSASLTTWPCDEINYIWRHGNSRLDHDELTAEHATPRVTRYIRRAFAKQAAVGGAPIVLEKTCASTLRVGFVDHVLPEARYIVIERDPVDAAASAMKRWTAPLETDYLTSKLKFVPPVDLPYYAFRYLGHRLAKIRSDEGRLPTWGPRFAGIDKSVATEPLHVLCALQWVRSVVACREGLSMVGGDRVTMVRYEDFVARSRGELERITAGFGAGLDASVVAAAARIKPTSVGRGRAALQAGQVRDIEAVVARELGA